MNSTFGRTFLFLTDFAFQNRVLLPMMVTCLFMMLDVRLQIEINIETTEDELPDLPEDMENGVEQENEVIEHLTNSSIEFDIDDLL